MSLFIDREIFKALAIDIVQFGAILNTPFINARRSRRILVG